MSIETRAVAVEGDHRRPVVVHRPVTGTWGGRPALVVDLHGSRGNAELQVALSGGPDLSAKHGVAVAAPEGATPMSPNGQPAGSWAWNVPGVPTTEPTREPERDDVAFLARVIDTLVDELGTDPHRTYLLGYSGGARMACACAARLPGKIAAVGAVAGLRAGRPDPADPYRPDPTDLPEGPPVPIIAFHGSLDPVNPVDGDGGRRWGYQVTLAARVWAVRNGASARAEEPQVTVHVRRRRHRSPSGSGDVEPYVTESDGQTWPGSRLSAPGQEMGHQTSEISATSLCWKFFSSRSRR